MRYRRRKPAVVWLPVHGRDFSDIVEQTNFANGIGGILTVPNTGEVVTDIQAVTFDYSDSFSAEEGSDQRSLQDLTQGNAYRLRRIVGKLHAGATVENDAKTNLPTVDLAAGFIINRTDPSGNVIAQARNGLTGNLDFGPLAQEGSEDPWIWRRRWLLGTIPPQASIAGTFAQIYGLFAIAGFQGLFPNTTAGYGSVLDGPHIDQKTARVISREERLMFWLQARMTNPSADTNNATVPWNLDVRLLASLRRNVGNRRNASR